jgi:hypothetical protein
MTDIADSIELDRMEKQLKNIFAPIEPDLGFVQKLKGKLKKKTDIYLENNEPVFYLLMAVLGVIVTIIIFFLITKKKN